MTAVDSTPSPAGPAGRRWKAVRRSLVALALLACVAAIALQPALAARYLSDDGKFAPASRRALQVGQVALLTMAAVSLLVWRRWQTPTRTRERIALGVASLAGSVVISALLAEAGLGLIHRFVKPLGAERHYFFEYDPVLGWKHRPGSRATFKDALVRIDADGLRVTGREREAYQSRVLLLGDSQAFGDGVAAEDTFAARIEADVPGLRVLNASVIGYGTDQQLLYLERDGLRHTPEAVVVAMNAYDLRDNLSARVRSGYAKPRFVATAGGLELTNVPVPGDGLADRLHRNLQHWSHLYRLLHRLRRNPDQQGGEEGGLPGRRLAQEVYPDDAHVARGVEVTTAIVGRLAQTARRAGSRLFVVFLPYQMDYGDDAAYKDRTSRVVASLEARAALDGFTFIDLRGELADAPAEGVFRDAMHLSTEGHRRVAAVLERALASPAQNAASRIHGR